MSTEIESAGIESAVGVERSDASEPEKLDLHLRLVADHLCGAHKNAAAVRDPEMVREVEALRGAVDRVRKKFRTKVENKY
jgi:hypothetical protein